MNEYIQSFKETENLIKIEEIQPNVPDYFVSVSNPFLNDTIEIFKEIIKS